jgi:hypothetical protein
MADLDDRDRASSHIKIEIGSKIEEEEPSTSSVIPKSCLYFGSSFFPLHDAHPTCRLYICTPTDVLVVGYSISPTESTAYKLASVKRLSVCHGWKGGIDKSHGGTCSGRA